MTPDFSKSRQKIKAVWNASRLRVSVMLGSDITSRRTYSERDDVKQVDGGQGRETYLVEADMCIQDIHELT